MKKIKYLLLVISLFFGFCKNVFAGSLSVSANANTITVGDKVTISVNAKELVGTFSIRSSDASVLSGPSSGNIENENKSYVFTASKAGTATITVVPIDMADFDTEGKFTQSKSVTIKVVNKSSGGSSSGGGSSSNNNSTTADVKEKSSDNSLSSLSVEGYELDPKFDKDKLEYTLTVDEVVETIKVNAKAKDSEAEVKGVGEIKLSPGKNTIEVKVIAENGNEKIYKLIVTVEDQHPIRVKVGNDYYLVVKKNKDLIDKLDGYDETIIQINNQDVVAYKNAKTNVWLVILKDSDNKLSYYVYNDKENSYKKYRYISMSGITLQLLDYDKKLDNYNKYKVTIQEQDLDIFKVKKSHKVGLVYGTNIKTGNTSFYVLDEIENTLSKYYDEEISLYRNRFKELKSLFMISIGIVALVAIILIIVSLVKHKNKKKRINVR